MLRRILFATAALAATAVVFGASSASAQLSAPTSGSLSGDSFGPLSSVNFGGIGLNGAVWATQFDGVTLALSATQRCVSSATPQCNPALTNDGAGTFFAQPGFDVNNPPLDNFAMWNFDYAIVGENLGSYNYFLYIDSNPAFDNSSGYFPFQVTGTTSNPFQNSMNMGMGTSLAEFDPNVAGQYGFVLAAYNHDGGLVGRTDMLVDVVPEPASMTLLATGLVGMAGAAMRRRKRSTKA